jgi:hypothetical protein
MERLFELLRNSGISVQYLTGSGKDDLGIVYSSDPTEDIKNQVSIILAGFDWSDGANQKWLADKIKQITVNTIDSNDIQALILRNTQKIMTENFQAVIIKLNELIQAHNDKIGDTIELLPQAKEWIEQADQLKSMIISEIF